jgi:Zn-finger in ubiquitin-hydrolases and other protein
MRRSPRTPGGDRLDSYASRTRHHEPMTQQIEIDPTIPPSGPGCVDCEATGGWWFHLRRCAHCGQVGCCDSSPSQHASHHAITARHPVIHSYEPGEDWFWDYASEQYLEGPALAPPPHHPLDQPVPGPAGRVPSDWERYLH